MKCEKDHQTSENWEDRAYSTVDDEQIEVVEHFKYLGSLKSADGNCSKGIRSLSNCQEKMLDLERHRNRCARWFGQVSPIAQKAGL